jgi:hypothetical protein
VIGGLEVGGSGGGGGGGTGTFEGGTGLCGGKGGLVSGLGVEGDSFCVGLFVENAPFVGATSTGTRHGLVRRFWWLNR